MPRKNTKDYTQMQIRKKVLKDLEKLKVHKNQSYSEVIAHILTKLNDGNDGIPPKPKGVGYPA